MEKKKEILVLFFFKWLAHLAWLIWGLVGLAQVREKPYHIMAWVRSSCLVILRFKYLVAKQVELNFFVGPAV